VLGRFDTASATSAMRRFSMSPGEGHMKAVKRILAYLKRFPKGRIIVNTTYPDHSIYTVEDLPNWRDFYPNVEEEIPNTPVTWVSKHQKTVETSTYGSELVASSIAAELILELRFMLRSWGVDLDRPTLMSSENMSVVINTTVPSIRLKFFCVLMISIPEYLSFILQTTILQYMLNKI
jgi:hypothetical protein